MVAIAYLKLFFIFYRLLLDKNIVKFNFLEYTKDMKQG